MKSLKKKLSIKQLLLSNKNWWHFYEKNKHAPIHKFLCVRALRRDFVQSWLNVEDKVRLVSWCSYSLYGFFQMELSEDKRLHHVLCGEQGQAEAMIAVNP